MIFLIISEKPEKVGNVITWKEKVILGYLQ